MSIYLRVKRLRSESHIVDEFEAGSSSKLPRLDSGSASSSVFRYIGTHSADLNDVTEALSELQKCESVGKCKLLWNAKSATILNENDQNQTACKVRVRTLKRTVSRDNLDDVPFAPKVLKVIDVTPNTVTQEPIVPLFNSIALNPSTTDDNRSETVDVDLVYDFYRLERRTDSQDSDCSDAESPYFHSDQVLFGDGAGFSDEDAPYEDDDDDSNSESNWRNDYPDEESDESDPNHSSSRSSRSSSPISPRLPRIGSWATSDLWDRLRGP